MTGVDVKNARRSRAWTQQEAARQLGVSQAYLSMLETGKRRLPPKHRAAFRRVYKRHLAPTALPLSPSPWPLPAARVARELASLGYEGYAYLRSVPRLNPAEVLLRALHHPALEARVVAGLVWLVVTYPDMEWSWVLTEARLRNLQNKVGFVLALARQVAVRLHKTRVARQLTGVHDRFDEARLAREDSFSTSLTGAEKAWLRKRRPEAARHWNLLTDLSVRDVSYG